MPKKVFISMCSFKDVFNHKESLELIENIVSDINPTIKIDSCSITDGGEYFHEIVKSNFKCNEVIVDDVVNAFKKTVQSKYLISDDGCAYISSSSILRIFEKDKRHKNPLNLTSYGLGQLINDALSKGIKKIYLGLGGTNTIDAGIGMLQALGVVFKDENNSVLKPIEGKYFSGKDLQKINYLECKKKDFYNSIEVISLCDGSISINDMDIPNNQKIGNLFEFYKSEILDIITKGIIKYSAINKIGVSQRYFGVAGGINISLNSLFQLKLDSGIKFFINNLGIEKKVLQSDLVITGEGRLDNSFVGKTPIGISNIAKKHGKRVLYLVGDVEPELKKHFNEDLSYNLPAYVKDAGITSIISCHNYNMNSNSKIDYGENTKIVFSRAIKKFLKTINL